MKHYLETNNLRTAIRRAKKMLKQKAKNSGLYENFGQDEVTEITDKFIDVSSYTYEMNSARALIREFDEWSMNFTI